MGGRSFFLYPRNGVYYAEFLFLENFWDYDSSPYVKEKLAHGHSIGECH